VDGGQPLRRDEPVATSRLKPFAIPKQAVWKAWLRVKANRGAAGVDEQSLAAFEVDLRANLYKLWNRMSSGSYFPPPVRAVPIPKRDGSGERILGVPTVADRIAQTVVADYLVQRVEPIFHPDSYGYRPGRGALDAVRVCRERCWKSDWVIDLDVRAFFDSIPHDLLLRAVAHHTPMPLGCCCMCGGGWLRRCNSQMAPWWRGTEVALRAPRSHRCSPTSSCTTPSMRGCPDLPGRRVRALRG